MSTPASLKPSAPASHRGECPETVSHEQMKRTLSTVTDKTVLVLVGSADDGVVYRRESDGNWRRL